MYCVLEMLCDKRKNGTCAIVFKRNVHFHVIRWEKNQQCKNQRGRQKLRTNIFRFFYTDCDGAINSGEHTCNFLQFENRFSQKNQPLFYEE